MILEITRPQREPLSSFYSLWFDRLVPVLGQFAGDHDAYSYLPESVRSFPEPEALAAKMDAAGLRRDPLAAAGRRDHRHPQRHQEPVTRSAVPPPVTAVMDAAGAWLPERMAEVEDRLAEVAVGHGPELGGEAEATLAAGGKRLRPLLVLICGREQARRRRRCARRSRSS